MTKLLCTGDWHTGAGAEYGRRPGDRLKDQRDVAIQIADLAIEEAVDGVLIAGDLLEGPSMLPEHLEVITAFIDRLQGRIPVLATLGNGRHDLALRETNGLAIFNHIDGIEVSSQPETVAFAGCAVSTLPWVSPARLVAARGGGDRDEVNDDVAQLLVAIAARGREDCARVAPGAPAILLGHWSVSGSSLPNGLPVDQLREPVIPVDDLDAVGFDHVVLGHIHRSQEVGERGFYVGSPMPLSFGEASTGHGVAILHTNERDVIDFYAAEYREITSRPFVTLDLGAEDLGGDVVRAEAVEEGAIVRVRYTAAREQQALIDTAHVRQQVLAAGAAVVKIQPAIVRADRARVEGLDETVDELQGLDLYIAANGVGEPLAGLMRDRTRRYLETAA